MSLPAVNTSRLRPLQKMAPRTCWEGGAGVVGRLRWQGTGGNVDAAHAAASGVPCLTSGSLSSSSSTSVSLFQKAMFMVLTGSRHRTTKA